MVLAVKCGTGWSPTRPRAARDHLCWLDSVIEWLITARQHQPGDADVLVVMDTGYEGTLMAFPLAGLPVIHMCGH